MTDIDQTEIESICADHDFPLADLTAGDDLLRLTPASLADLPNANDLQTLADAVEDRGYRFVTFVVPEAG